MLNDCTSHTLPFSEFAFLGLQDQLLGDLNIISACAVVLASPWCVVIIARGREKSDVMTHIENKICVTRSVAI